MFRKQFEIPKLNLANTKGSKKFRNSFDISKDGFLFVTTFSSSCTWFDRTDTNTACGVLLLHSCFLHSFYQLPAVPPRVDTPVQYFQHAHSIPMMGVGKRGAY